MLDGRGTDGGWKRLDGRGTDGVGCKRCWMEEEQTGWWKRWWMEEEQVRW